MMYANLNDLLCPALQTELCKEVGCDYLQLVAGDQLVYAIKREFLSEGAAGSSYYEPRIVDKFTASEVEEFVNNSYEQYLFEEYCEGEW